MPMFAHGVRVMRLFQNNCNFGMCGERGKESVHVDAAPVFRKGDVILRADLLPSDAHDAILSKGLTHRLNVRRVVSSTWVHNVSVSLS